MKKYLESYMLSGVVMIIVTGISVQFVSSLPLIGRIAILVLCLIFSGFGVYVFNRYMRTALASQPDKPLTAGLLLRSGIIAAGACMTYFSLSDFEKDLLPSMNILVGALALVSLALLGYHLYLYYIQLRNPQQ